MELRDVGSGRFVRLSPVRYEFPGPSDNSYDRNWLFIRGEASSGEEEWSFEEPSLQTSEAEWLGVWLRTVANGTATQQEAEPSGRIWPTTEFIEPNIGIALIGSTATQRTLRVFLWLESGPPSVRQNALTDNMEFFLDLVVSVESVSAAADAWTAELSPFPWRD